jgi:hypothetical protein
MCVLVRVSTLDNFTIFEGTKVVRVGLESEQTAVDYCRADVRQHGYQRGFRFLAWPRDRAVTRLTHVSVDTAVRSVAVWDKEYWASKGNWRGDDL